MTFQPPPPPPPPGGPPPPPGGQPPGYGPPPPGGNPYGAPGANPYGAPGGNPYGAPSRGFDPKSVNPLDWAILGAGFLILILSFLGYYKYSSKGSCSLGGCVSFTNSAWHGFFGWFGVLLIVIATAAVAVGLFAPQVKMPVPSRLVGLGAWALGTLCILLTVFIYPGTASYAGFSGSTSAANKSHGISFWIILILAIGGLVVMFMRFQQSGGALPGALGRMPNIGGHGPGGNPPPPPPPPGYGPPAGGGGYGPPAP